MVSKEAVMGKWEEWEESANELAKVLRLDRHGRDSALGKVSDMLPELAEMVRVVTLGAVYARPGLDLKTRALCTIAALTVLGKEPILRDWIGNAIAAGVSKEEILEVIHQMGIYGGQPARIIALGAAKAAFEEMGV
jgi:4-carboxymuconolactone decarboxylase